MLAGSASARHRARESEESGVERLRHPDDVVEWGRRDGPFELADEDAGLSRCEPPDGLRAEPRREKPVEGSG